jgi:hypothetical protein
MSYEAYRNNKIESGLRYQDFAIDLLYQTIGLVVVQYASRMYQISIGESRTGVEIKHDEKYATTGNLWIEVAEKARPRDGDYFPSGICRDDNSWFYVIGNYDIVFGFQKTLLLALRTQAQKYPIRENKTRTSQGFLLRDEVARRCAAFVLTPNAEQKISKAIGDLHELGRQLHQAVLVNPAQRSLFETLSQ